MLDLFILQDLLAGAFQSFSAELKDDGTMGDLQGLLRILFHHDDGATFRVDPLNGLKDLGYHQGGKTQRGLVELDYLKINIYRRGSYFGLGTADYKGYPRSLWVVLAF